MSEMVAFHGKQDVKDFYIARVKAHYDADEIIHGQYWERGKGCAVGCTIHSSAHANFETELGIPRVIARLEDRIFEGMVNGDSKEFPLQFLTEIPVGADLSLVIVRFMLWLLADPDQGVIRFANTDRTKAAVNAVAALYERVLKGDTPSAEDWDKARRSNAAAAAYADAADAYAADAYAAYAAYAADDAYAAYAADAAAYAAAAAAADAAAAAAADAYAAYAAADAAYAAARQNSYRQMRDKLLHLLAEAPVNEAVPE